MTAIKHKSPLALRLRHSQLRGSDELMLTQRQINKFEKSLATGKGSDIKISKTQIRRSLKYGGNLFTSLASLGAKLLPFAIRGASKVAPALATGAASALGEIEFKKLFGKGGTKGAGVPSVTIPKRFLPMLPPFAREFTKAQINQIYKAYKTGGRLVIKPTRRQVEGGFLGTLASIGIPMAISLLSKMFGSGLQVDRGSSSNTRNVYVPPVTQGKGRYFSGYPHRPPPFIGTWEDMENKEPLGMGVAAKGGAVKSKKKSPKAKVFF